jgi:CheY-like chemotaxis protein
MLEFEINHMTHILFADDNAMGRREFPNVFGGDGITITIASSPEEAIQHLQQNQVEPYTAVVCDGFYRTGWQPVIEAAKQSGVSGLVVLSGDYDIGPAVIDAGAQFVLKGQVNYLEVLRAAINQENATGGPKEQEP